MKKPIKVDLKLHIVKIASIAFILLGLFLSCNSQKKGMTNRSSNVDNSLVLVLCDNYSGSEVEQMLVVRDTQTLRTFFSKANRTRKPGLPVPTIDFSKEMLIIHCSGEQLAGRQPQLYILEETLDELVVGVKYLEASSGTAIVTPFCVYKLWRTPKPVVFKK